MAKRNNKAVFLTAYVQWRYGVC